ncbi:MAG: galactokinase [Candidatus Melainabacteria bacterium]|nr:galactokinase [Candidatus Melainabacteria bacterium]
MQSTRLKTVQDAFSEQYGDAPQMVVRAPGRVNLIGEHTDYNEGFVFPVAIDREMLVAASVNGSDKVQAFSLDYAEVDSFDLNDIKHNDDHSSWSNYLRGVVDTLQKAGYKIGGFNAVLSGNVPQGAGLSSSAAFEVAVATVCNAFFDLGISGKDIALLSQKAENQFIGVQCGIMDQFISALGEEDSALMIDCKTLDYKVVPLKLSTSGYSIVITNSGVRRGLVDSEYNARRQECVEGTKGLSELTGRPMNSLRDASVEDLDKHGASLPDKVLRRSRHVVSENQRVLDAVKALESGDIVRFGELMNESHESMRDDFEISCSEINTLVELSQKFKGVAGARLTGAGFGGCTVAIVANDQVDNFKEVLIPEYEKLTGRKAEVYVCSATAGAGPQ